MIDFFNAEHWVTYALGLAAKIQLGEKEILFLKESLKDARLTKVIFFPLLINTSWTQSRSHSMN